MAKWKTTLAKFLTDMQFEQSSQANSEIATISDFNSEPPLI